MLYLDEVVALCPILTKTSYVEHDEHLLLFYSEVYDKLTKYKIIFKLCNNDYVKDGKISDNGIDIEKCEFYDELFHINPHNLEYVNCHGDKCCNDFDYYSTGIWCTGCHGELDDAFKLWSLLKEQIIFTDIPLDAIVRIEKTIHTENVTMKHIDEVTELNKEIAILDDKINELTKRRKKLEDRLNVIQ